MGYLKELRPRRSDSNLMSQELTEINKTQDKPVWNLYKNKPGQIKTICTVLSSKPLHFLPCVSTPALLGKVSRCSIIGKASLRVILTVAAQSNNQGTLVNLTSFLTSLAWQLPEPTCYLTKDLRKFNNKLKKNSEVAILDKDEKDNCLFGLQMLFQTKPQNSIIISEIFRYEYAKTPWSVVLFRH